MMMSPLDLLLFPSFLSVFGAIYLIASHTLFHTWPPHLRPEAASCLLSLAHGTPAAVLAAWSILLGNPTTATTTPFHFASPNSAFQAAVLDFSSAYFVIDLLHYLLHAPSAHLFIAHHLATLFVLLTCRHLALHGATAVLGLLVLAEATSLCQNLWTLTGMRKDVSSAAARVHGIISPPFYALYSIVRGLLGPVFLYRMAVFYLSGKAADVIPYVVSLSWVVVVAGAIALSILWVLNNWVVLYRERMVANRMAKKAV